MLNWFKKMIGKEEESEQQEQISNVHKFEIAPSSENHIEQEAPRMTYQYPKGKFRFPLIPDEVAIEKRTEKKQPRNEWKYATDIQSTPSLHRERPKKVHTEEPAPYQYKKHRSFYEPSEAKNNHNNGSVKNEEKIAPTPTKKNSEKKKPFAPTPFYSAIYGSKLPRKQSEYNRKELFHKSVGIHEDEDYTVIVEEKELVTSSQFVKEEQAMQDVNLHNKDEYTEEIVFPVDANFDLTDFQEETHESVDVEASIKSINNIQEEDSVEDSKTENGILSAQYENDQHQCLYDIEAVEQNNEVDVSKEEDVIQDSNSNNEKHDEFDHLLALADQPQVIMEHDSNELVQIETEIMNHQAEDEKLTDETDAVITDYEMVQNEQQIDENQSNVIKEIPEVINELAADTEEVVMELQEEIEIMKEVDLESSKNIEENLQKECKDNESNQSKNELGKEEEKSDIIRPEQLNEVKKVEEHKRKRVPFNVLMLKKDRLLYERTKTQKTLPSLQLLSPAVHDDGQDMNWLLEQKDILDDTFSNFNVRAKVVSYSKGPSVTRFEVHPEPGVKVNKVTNLADDIKLALSARDIRLEAPIPGKNTIGIEVPNANSRPVKIKEILGSSLFLNSSSPLTVAIGLDISGRPIVSDISKMPHGLIAGATGSGKSVCINSILISLLYKATPEEVRLILIDPKMVELAPYNEIPHLVSPVITDVKAATNALKWSVEEMERRYELFVAGGARDIKRYNELVEKGRIVGEKLPYLVIIIDELADLMLQAPAEVEEAICRIAQKARACGIHMLIATQRPSVDVITGLIKANIPTRMSFSVFSQVDSRTVLDIAGAEKLLGKGDMLILENGMMKPIRVQGTYVSDDEIERVLEFVKRNGKPQYLFEQEDLLSKFDGVEAEDELFQEVCEFFVEQGAASTSLLQRRFRIGYNRAARLMDTMEAKGIISEAKGSKPRDVLLSREDLAELFE